MKKFLMTMTLACLFFLLHNISASAAANTYIVKKGDTLFRISKMYHTTVEELIHLNNLKTDQLQLNQKLNVPGAVQAVKAAATAVPATTVNGIPANMKVVKTLSVSASAYTAGCGKCSGVTTLGFNLKKNPGLKVISVDPSVIKLGTKVYVEGYGLAIAGDKGSAIKGNKIDVFIPDHKKALQWGRKTVKVYILQ